ncbi:MAG: major capsid protein [Peptococcaceae bacterium]|jgi:hypothetical protein|nr:major capsid protein [Peptococcaceae bacterium]
MPEYNIATLADEIKAVLQTSNTLGYVRESRPRRPMIFEELFPITATEELDYKFYLQQGGEDVPMALFMSFDSETPLNALPGFGEMFGNLVKVGSKLPLEESDIIHYSRLPAAERENFGLSFRAMAERLGNAVREWQEVMAMEIISKGTFTPIEGQLKGFVDFRVPGEQNLELTGADVWSDPASNPIEDLNEFMDILDRNNRLPAGQAIMSGKVFAALKNHPIIRAALSPIGTSAFNVTDAALKGWFSDNGLPVPRKYDRPATVLLPDGKQKRFKPFPEDKIVFIPDEPLGQTLEGPTVEAALSQATFTDSGNISGPWHSVVVEDDPPRIYQKVVATTFITFPMSQQILIAKVL